MAARQPYTCRPWTADDDAFLMEQFRAGVKQQLIGVRMNRSRTSVNARLAALRRLGAIPAESSKYRRWSRRDVSRLKRLYAYGHSRDVIAETLGRSIAGINVALGKHASDHIISLRASILRMRERGVPEEELVKKLEMEGVDAGFND